jgi:hypothetical protein
MNRQQKRRQERVERAAQKEKESWARLKEIAKKDKAVSDFNSLLEKQRLEATKGACELMVGVFLLALNGEFGFGTGRLHKVMVAVREQMECFAAGTVTIEDMKSWMLEHNIDLEGVV